MKKISAVLASVAIAVLFWYLAGAVFVLKGSNDDISKLQCVSYAPFSKDESPLSSQNFVASKERVREDLALLSKYTNCIRTYSTIGLEELPNIAREFNMKMLMGAWVSSDRVLTQKELNTLIKLARENQDIVKAVIVGNEVLLRGDTTEAKLLEYIKYVKAALPNTQVTYADVWEFWLKHPKIRETTDFVTIHILPYWEDEPMNIQRAIKHLANIRVEVERILGDKNILIGETGWPSEGRAREDAHPSKINQAIYLREFVKLAQEKKWNYNIIEAFDQPWKRINEGAVGGFWGIFDKNRVDKNVFNKDVSNFPNYNLLALSSILLIFAFSFILKGVKIETKKLSVFSALNLIYAVLFTLQIEQYSVTTISYKELIWAIFVLVVHLLIYYYMLYFIAKEKQSELLGKNGLRTLFYLSFLSLLIANTALAFDGRYRNFEVYIFAISAISFLYFYSAKALHVNSEKFEKASFLIIILSSIAIFINETYLNIFSNIWILISLGFAFILYKESKQVSFLELKNFIFYTLLSIVIFSLIKYAILRNANLISECGSDSKMLLCTIREQLGAMIHFNFFGIAALLSTITALILNRQLVSHIALFLSMGALIMLNSYVGSFVFIASVYLVLKESNKKAA
ncbi:MAG: glycosyl hydrolase [Sulfurimonas sp. RIFOXYD12_FULL_33_39]|nr:MAG: glycosyl hydrolase [Sulfurimonas sp. RIFCSPLOWO2_12_FULL_34_6]OHE10278.1 MAG: glycosyl hydrolase [Sulfurimonas sp. RIFOXYD12_FULL_33_39]OHE14808.1 MAG: glycosyl hydrolase [Sulfurimonas sp. RIFOXYD2_FULL_34_21]DAB27922.1 MAG TPA: glycosyl hydrolase [Sulfurimonas sp. UBA10385]